MEHNSTSEVLDRVPNDIRGLILSLCDLRTAIRLSQISRIWHECTKDNRIWKQMYKNIFDKFNPQPDANVADWKEEIKKKIKIYGFDFEQYTHLLGNVKIKFNMDPPIEDLGDGSHIHRRLELLINDRLLPYMGYFGPDDVCYSDWIQDVFEDLFRCFDKGEKEHLWDFCDQGMPAFQFVKEGPICKLSIVEGAGGGMAHLGWQNIEFLVEDLREEYIKFLKELYEKLITKYGNNGQEFWDGLGIEQIQIEKKLTLNEEQDVNMN